MKLLHGIFSTSINEVVFLLISIFSILLVTNFLTPQNYGEYLVAFAFYTGLTRFFDFNFGKSLLTNNKVSLESISTIYVFNILKGLILFLILNLVMLLMPSVLSIYSSRIHLATFFVSFTILISGFTNVGAIYLLKDLQYKTHNRIILIQRVSEFIFSACIILIIGDAIYIGLSLVVSSSVRVICSFLFSNAKAKLILPSISKFKKVFLSFLIFSNA